MRIGILTFSNAFNLGAALQAHSLQKTLEEMGNDAELIDYRCPAIEAMHKLRPVFQMKIGMKPRIYNLIYNIVFFPRRIRYKLFQRHMNRSKTYSRQTISDTNNNYDLFIAGSDQIFNLKLTGNDSTFFLDFVAKEKVKASYAASLGTYLAEKKVEYQNYFSKFDYLSVRERSSAELMQRELGVAAKVMPDPVFLHTEDEWKKLLNLKGKENSKYVLVYSLIETEELYTIARRVSLEKGLKIVVITKALRPMGKADRFIRNAGPKEFIELIAKADYIVTNSFHGTAFSVIFKKSFTVLLPQAAPDRILDLLEIMDLKERIYSAEKLVMDPVDYSEREEKIYDLKMSGEQYLRQILCEEGN